MNDLLKCEPEKESLVSNCDLCHCHLFRTGQLYLLGCQHIERMTSVLETHCDFAHALKVLRLASIRGHEEVSWLVGKLEAKMPLCTTHKKSWSRQRDWAKSLFLGDESPHALGYAAAFDRSPEVGERSLAWRAATAGDVLGLHFFGKFCMPQTEAIAFFEKAAAKQCALSMYALAAHRIKEGDLCAAAALHIRAAHLGYHRSIEWLNECYNYSQNRPWKHLDLPLLARAVWWGRSAILFGDFCLSPFDEHLEKLIANTKSDLDEAVAVVYAIGRECDSYCDIYRKLPYPRTSSIVLIISVDELPCIVCGLCVCLFTRMWQR